MEISSTTSAAYQPISGSESFAKIKQSFQSLGSALDAGNLSDAQAAFAQLQKNAPASSTGKENDPMSSKMAALGKSLDSGDIKAAQDAYADIKKTMSQRPSGSKRPAGGAGAPPSGGAKKSAGGSSSSDKVYDKRDTNKDGTVSEEEKIAYTLAHPEDAEKSSTSVTNDNDNDNSQIDVTA